MERTLRKRIQQLNYTKNKESAVLRFLFAFLRAHARLVLFSRSRGKRAKSAQLWGTTRARALRPALRAPRPAPAPARNRIDSRAYSSASLGALARNPRVRSVCAHRAPPCSFPCGYRVRSLISASAPRVSQLTAFGLQNRGFCAIAPRKRSAIVRFSARKAHRFHRKTSILYNCLRAVVCVWKSASATACHAKQNARLQNRNNKIKGAFSSARQTENKLIRQ